MLSLSQVGSKQGGGECTLHNSEDFVELQKLNEKYAIDREEQRLNLIQELAAFQGKFGHWGTREYAEHRDMINAANHAMGLIDAVLRGNEASVISHVKNVAFAMNYVVRLIGTTSLNPK